MTSADATARTQVHATASRKPLLAIAATFTAEPIEETLAFWCRRLDLPFEVAFAPYNQVFQELLGEGLLHRNQQGVNVLLVRPQDWQRHGESQVEQGSTELVVALRHASTRSPVPFVLVLCPPSPAALADARRGDGAATRGSGDCRRTERHPRGSRRAVGRGDAPLRRRRIRLAAHR